MANLGIEPASKVRFAFWGAEELGLLGSSTTSTALTRRAARQDLANLNFDMLGSPNFVRFVYDGDGSDTGPAGPARIGADRGHLHRLLRLAGPGVPTRRAFDGRSDYGPFIAVGIPAGGLFTGAEGIKTAGAGGVYGGTAGEPYDPCYHQACDTSQREHAGPGEMGDAAAHAVSSPRQVRPVRGRQPPVPASARRRTARSSTLTGTSAADTSRATSASRGPVASSGPRSAAGARGRPGHHGRGRSARSARG